MSPEEIQKYAALVTGWTVRQNKEIIKGYVFKNFSQALRFVNEVGAIAEQENHHPDILLHDWKEVEIRLSTHAVGGLFINDFILASKIDEMHSLKFQKET